MASLLVYSACDSGVDFEDPISHNRPIAIDLGNGIYKTASLEDALAALAGEVDSYIGDLPDVCLQPTFTDSDLDDLDQEAEELMSQLGDGITMANFYDSVDDIDIAASDTAKWRQDAEALSQEYVDLLPTACITMDTDLMELGNQYLNPYASQIAAMEPGEFRDAIDDMRENQIHPADDPVEECRSECRAEYSDDAMEIIGMGIGFGVGCTVFGPFLWAGCVTGAFIVGVSRTRRRERNMDSCMKECDEIEIPTECNGIPQHDDNCRMEDALKLDDESWSI